MNKKTEESATLGAVLAREYRKLSVGQCGMLASELQSVGRMATLAAVRQCNVANFDWEKARARIVRRLDKLQARFGVKIKARITGDPRGYCLKLKLKSGAYNTWGGADEGWGI